MAPLIALALKLAPHLIPSAVRALAGDNAAETASKVLDIAKQVTGAEGEQEAVEAVIRDPAAQLQFQKMLSDERLEFERLAVRQEEIAAADRGSAREREIKTGDRTPAWLAFFVTIGFFGVLGYLLTMGKPMAGGDALLVMLGSLGTAWTAIISYYYGSSSSSRSKDETIGRMAGK